MIKRELYMNRIRPFIGGELIKVMTGIRRSGKSVMLELIKEELAEAGVAPSQMISINFEDMRYSHLQTATACLLYTSPLLSDAQPRYEAAGTPAPQGKGHENPA